MITLIYTNHADIDVKAFAATLRTKADSVLIRNGSYWAGEIEKCNKVLVAHEFAAIADAYAKAGMEVSEYGAKPKMFKEPLPIPEPVVQPEQAADESDTGAPKVDGRSKTARASRNN